MQRLCYGAAAGKPSLWRERIPKALGGRRFRGRSQRQGAWKGWQCPAGEGKQTPLGTAGASDARAGGNGHPGPVPPPAGAEKGLRQRRPAAPRRSGGVRQPRQESAGVPGPPPRAPGRNDAAVPARPPAQELPAAGPGRATRRRGRGTSPSARPSRGREAPSRSRAYARRGPPRPPASAVSPRPPGAEESGGAARAVPRPAGSRPVPTATAASASSFPPRHAAPTPAPLTGHGGVAAPPSLGQDGSRSEPNLRQRLYKVGRDLRRRRVSRRPRPRADYKSRRAPRWGPRACARWWRPEGPPGGREASAAGSSPPVRPGPRFVRPGLGEKLAGTVLNKHSVPRLQVGSARALVGLSRAAGRRSGLVSLSQQPSRAGAWRELCVYIHTHRVLIYVCVYMYTDTTVKIIEL